MPLTDVEKSLLLSLAQDAVAAAARRQALPEPPPEVTPALQEVRGAFVTLHRRGRLRGCIGLIKGCYPLAETVIRMAAAASRNDPRFKAVGAEELGEMEVEISVLSPLKQVSSAEEIVLGRDGVLVQCQGRGGVFLPQVAEETGWCKEEFLNELCAGKACLSPDAWRQPDCELYTFTVEIIRGPGTGNSGLRRD